MHTYMHVCVYVCVCLCMCMCICVNVCMCLSVYVYMCACVYVCTKTTFMALTLTSEDLVDVQVALKSVQGGPKRVAHTTAVRSAGGLAACKPPQLPARRQRAIAADIHRHDLSLTSDQLLQPLAPWVRMDMRLDSLFVINIQTKITGANPNFSI